MLKKVIKLNLDDLAVITAVLVGVFLLLELIVGIIMAAVKPNSVPTLAGLLLPCVAVVMGAFINVMHIPMTFDSMLRYSVTRKSALVCTLIVMVLETAWAFLLTLALAQVDRLIAGLWLRARPDLFLEELAVPLWGVVTMAAVIIPLGLVGGTALHRFERKALWVIWGGWLAFIIVRGVLGWNDINLVNIPPAYIPAVAAVAIGLAALCVRYLLRASVKN